MRHQAIWGARQGPAENRNQTIKCRRHKSNNQNPTNTTFPPHSFSESKQSKSRENPGKSKTTLAAAGPARRRRRSRGAGVGGARGVSNVKSNPDEPTQTPLFCFQTPRQTGVSGSGIENGNLKLKTSTGYGLSGLGHGVGPWGDPRSRLRSRRTVYSTVSVNACVNCQSRCDPYLDYGIVEITKCTQLRALSPLSPFRGLNRFFFAVRHFLAARLHP